jgi:putative cardiolipin synthase
VHADRARPSPKLAAALGQDRLTGAFRRASLAGPALRLPTRLAIALALLAAAGCASLPTRTPGSQSFAIPAGGSAELARIAAQSIPEGDGFRPLPTSAFSMDARLTLARHAQRSLDLQYYLIQNDSTGRTLLRAVRDAAVRGVRVRILVDDLYTARSDRMLLGLAAYPNVEVRVFNPFPAGRAFMATRFLFSAFDFARINHRMHNKLFVADGSFAIAGGRNIADEYFFRSKEGNFIDFDILLAGPVVPSLEQIFDEYWNSRWVYPFDALETSHEAPTARQAAFEVLTAAEANPATLAGDAIDPFSGYHALSTDIGHPPLDLIRGHVRAFADSPEKVSGKSVSGDDPTTVTAQVIAAFGTARKSLLLVSPYFVPSEQGLQGLAEARAHGISVDIVTNSMAANDEPLVTAAYARYRREMLKMGIGLYEVSSRELKFSEQFRRLLGSTTGRSHAKLAVIDERVVFVGSMNLDLRSSRLNTELGLLVDSPEFAEGVDKAIKFIRSTGCFQLRLREPGDAIEWVSNSSDGSQIYTSDPEVDLGTQLEILFMSPFVSDTDL